MEVTSRSPIKYKGKTILVEPIPVEPEADPRRLEVCGLNPATDIDTVEMFFESKRKCDGGDLAKDMPIEYDQGSGRAVITFADEAGTCIYI